MNIKGRVLNKDVYKLENAINDEIDIYLSVKTLNLSDLRNDDILALRYGEDTYIFKIMQSVELRDSQETPDDGYWNHESIQYIEAINHKRFKKELYIDKIKWNKLGMATGQGLNEIGVLNE